MRTEIEIKNYIKEVEAKQVLRGDIASYQAIIRVLNWVLEDKKE